MRDPLFDYLRDVWDKKLAKRFGDKNLVKYGGGIWPLGPGLVTTDNAIERANPYRLKSTRPCGHKIVNGRRTVIEHPGEDFLLNYWFGRYHGML